MYRHSLQHPHRAHRPDHPHSGCGREEDQTAESEPRKFRQWKLIVNWFSGTTSWRDLKNYGCNCLPKGGRQIFASGHGKPIDMIDTACKIHHQCFMCLRDQYKNDDKQCIGEDQRYKMAAVVIDDERAVF